MGDEIEIPICDKEFIVEALKEQLRTDGRGPQDMRKPSFEFSLDGSSSTVLMGKTRVFTSVHAELGEPSPVQPHQGCLFFDVDFSPMASLTFKEQRNNESIIIMRMIERLIFFSKALDREALCIIAGQVAWNLKVDIHVLDHDGNLMDACCLGALSALCAYRRPDISVDPQTGKITQHSVEEREPLPLTLHHLPIPVTFAFFEDGELVVMDPDIKEEAATTGSMTVVVDPQGKICGVHKVKGIGLSLAQTMNCVATAVNRGQEISKILQEALKAYEVARVKSRVRRKDDLSFLSQATGKMIAAVPRVSVRGDGAKDTAPSAAVLEESESLEEMESASSSEPSQSDVEGEGNETNTSTSGDAGRKTPADMEPDIVLQKAAGVGAPPISRIPKGGMDEAKIQEAAAFIAGASARGEEELTDLKDAIKKRK
ncbi:hypothetical protein BSKO_08757 [Bryopsis sp. KO-2023]|nr:hypothetical protein BSKO_08757 [Bryopsis sp. KO-2023]